MGLITQNITWNTLGLVTVFKNGSGTVVMNVAYDAFGRRVWSQVPGANPSFFIYDGDMLIGEVQVWGPGSNPATMSYTWGAAGLISEHTYYPGKSLWYHYGPQGETRQLTNTAQQVVDTYTYTAYGELKGYTGTDPNPFRFGGQVGYYTPITSTGAVWSPGLVWCGSRWYNPQIGRWISRDPIGYEGGPILYEYCRLNAVWVCRPERAMARVQDMVNLIICPVSSTCGRSVTGCVWRE